MIVFGLFAICLTTAAQIPRSSQLTLYRCIKLMLSKKDSDAISAAVMIVYSTMVNGSEGIP